MKCNSRDRSDAAAQRFLVNWFERNLELIDQYQPDMLWFDNGVDVRYLDALKLRVAAYYYNRAKAWGKDVSLSTCNESQTAAGSSVLILGSVRATRGGARRIAHLVGGRSRPVKVTGSWSARLLIVRVRPARQSVSARRWAGRV